MPKASATIKAPLKVRKALAMDAMATSAAFVTLKS